MATIPQKLTNFRVYHEDEQAKLIGTADVTLPSIEFQTDTLKGAGIGGEIDVPIIGHTGSMTLTLNWLGTVRNMFLLAKPETQLLTLRGNLQLYDFDTKKRKPVHKQVKITVRGLPKKIELGKFEVAAGQDASTELEVHYLKVEFDAETQILIDKYNLQYVVQGIDYLEDVRNNLTEG